MRIHACHALAACNDRLCFEDEEQGGGGGGGGKGTTRPPLFDACYTEVLSLLQGYSDRGLLRYQATGDAMAPAGMSSLSPGNPGIATATTSATPTTKRAADQEDEATDANARSQYEDQLLREVITPWMLRVLLELTAFRLSCHPCHPCHPCRPCHPAASTPTITHTKLKLIQMLAHLTELMTLADFDRMLDQLLPSGSLIHQCLNEAFPRQLQQLRTLMEARLPLIPLDLLRLFRRSS